MKCFLLAAGLGTRLRPLTEKIPKCLLPVNGTPLLGIWLSHLQRHGVEQVLVNTHWLTEEVERFARGWNSSGPEIVLYNEPRLLGSGGTLWRNRSWIKGDEPFFIVYGDTLSNVDLTKMADFHKEHGMVFTLGVFETDKPHQCGIVDLSEGGVVSRFVEKPKVPFSYLAAAGVYIADRRIFDFFPPAGSFNGPDEARVLDLSHDVIPRMVGKIKAYLIRELLIDIGTPESYHKAQALWNPGPGEIGD